MSKRVSAYDMAVPYLIRALTPLHPGSGARVSGVVDLPIQREAHTGLPVIYGSSIKGSLRSVAPRKLTTQGTKPDDAERKVKEIFGSEPGETPLEMGRAIFTDAKLLFFPVKSLRGVYAWVTSPFILSRFSRDMEIVLELVGNEAGISKQAIQGIGNVSLSDPETALVPASSSEITIETGTGRVVVLEDVGLKVQDIRLDLSFLGAFGRDLKEEVFKRLAVVHHDVFMHLLARGMEIAPHIRIDPGKGTVEEGGLWYQENLPPETVFYATVFTTSDLCDAVRSLLSGYVQMGGDATTGLGIVEILGVGVRCGEQQG